MSVRTHPLIMPCARGVEAKVYATDIVLEDIHSHKDATASLHSNALPPPPLYPSLPIAQYTPLHFAASSESPQYRYEEGEGLGHKRKHSEALHTSFQDERARRDGAQGLQGGDPRYQSQAQYGAPPPEPYGAPPSQGQYSASTPSQHHGVYPPQAQYRSLPFLPGADMYKRRQVNQKRQSSPNNVHSANTSRAREHTILAPYDAQPLPSHRTRPRIDPQTEQRLARHGYRSTSEQLSETSRLHMGTQHNPVEIESSPEPELAGKASKKNKKKFYVVAAGYVPGIYQTWAEVEPLIKGYSGAKHRSFATEVEARTWLEENRRDPIRQFRYSDDVGTKPETFGRMHGNSAPIQSSHFAQDAANAPLPPFIPSEPGGPTGDNMQTISGAADFVPLPPLTEPVGASNTSSTIEPALILKPEQQMVVDLILEGHNVFYTGSAGCGKSTILKAFVKQLQLRGKNVKIVAPTNLAALNVGGITTWSFAGWTPDSMKRSLDTLMKGAHGKEVWERFDKTDVLVIDEISMVENLLFERLNYIMKASIGERKGGGAFGGVQVIVTGDVSIDGRWPALS
jgi:hypothetical protein